ncbi:MAG: hypothetical protein ACQEW8_15430 [Actinomycetota bacterium]
MIAFVEGTAELLGGEGWLPDHGAWAEGCTLPNGDRGASYGYALLAEQGTDFDADAQKVAEHWESLGMNVRVVEQGGPVVYATGGPVVRAAFGTGPTLYDVGAVAECVPGDSAELNEEDHAERAKGNVLPGDVDVYFHDQNNN